MNSEFEIGVGSIVTRKEDDTIVVYRTTKPYKIVLTDEEIVGLEYSFEYKTTKD